MRPFLSLVMSAALFAVSVPVVFASKADRVAVAERAQAKLAASEPGRLQLAPIDVAKLAREDTLLDGKFGIPLRYGVVQDASVVDLQAKNAGGGIWTSLADGRLRWQLDVVSVGAKTLDFGFSRFRLPHGAELVIRALDSKDALGPFTDADNRADGRFYTPLLLGSAATIELTLPAEKRETFALALDTVNHGYRDPFETLASAKSGSCNIDSICPQGDAWRNQIASVAHYTFQTGGSGFVCTGQLMATGNTSLDRSAPRFSTAHHCVSTSAEVQSMVFYWGYESPTCRTPGSAASGQSLARSISRATQNGAQLLATHEATDWTAVQLSAPVPTAALAQWSGWDRSGATPAGSVGIHHPAGHEKRITFNNDPLTTAPSCIIDGTANNTHWFISEYESGTTEGGSSGSGLWDSNSKLLVGVLSGGTASCAAPDESDCYGRLSIAWEAGTTPTTRMRDHFDRTGTNPQQMPGSASCAAPTVTLSSTAFTTAPTAGQTVQINATATGGAGGNTYAWDLDGDGGTDQSGSTSTVSTVYGTRQSVQVKVVVTDSAGCSATASQALDIKGPAIDITAAAPTQVCGNGNASIDPGERWQVPMTVRNSGDATLVSGARALFSGSSEYGVSAGTAAGCSFGFVDIANGANAVAALTLSASTSAPASDDGRTAQAIALGGGGLRLHGSTYTQAVMSTNGYVSFTNTESGGDYDNACNSIPDRGATGPQLRPLHDDLVVGAVSGSGLRYRYFATCPRSGGAGSGPGCHVFQWSHMQQYVNNTTASGDFEFQALVYQGSGKIVYQYNTASPNSGSNATIGLVSASNDIQDARCNAANAAPAQSAICLAPLLDSVRPETPSLPLQVMNAGAQSTTNLTFSVPATAACGAPLGIDYIGTAGDAISSVAPERVLNASVGATCTAVSNCPIQSGTIATREGLYFNPKRPGNGLASYSYGGGWYTADTDRKPTWYQLAGAYTDNLLRMPLRETFNSAAPGGVAVGLVERGSAWIARVDTARVLFAWQFDDGRSGAEIMSASLAPAPRPTVNHTETWFAPSQPGWGLAIESVLTAGQTLEGYGVFIYDNAGDPRWVLGTGNGSNGTAVALFGYRPHCPGCPWLPNWAATQSPAGTLTPTFSGETGGTVNTAITLPGPLQGTWNRTNLPIVPVLPPTR